MKGSAETFSRLTKLGPTSFKQTSRQTRADFVAVETDKEGSAFCETETDGLFGMLSEDSVGALASRGGLRNTLLPSTASALASFSFR